MKTLKNVLLLLAALGTAASPCPAMRYVDSSTTPRDAAALNDGPNLYTYVNQNPWSKFDPEGLWADSYSDWDKASNDAAAQGGAVGWTKAVGVQLARHTLQTLSLGTFSKNSHIGGEVAAGRISPEDGQIAVAGNALAGTLSVAAGGGAYTMLKTGGAGLILAGAGSGLAQSTTQVVGQHAVAAATGTPHTNVADDARQIAGATAVGTVFGMAGAADEAIAANRAAQANSAAMAPTSSARVTRYMSQAEAETAARTGQIPNTDVNLRPRPTHVTTDAPLDSASQAQKAYELGQTPTHRATVPAAQAGPLGPTPDGRPTTSGGGSQSATPNPIPVKPEQITPLGP